MTHKQASGTQKPTDTASSVKTRSTNNQTSILTFFGKRSKGLLTQRKNITPSPKPVPTRKQCNTQRNSGFIQTMLKLRPNFTRKNTTHEHKTSDSPQSSVNTQSNYPNIDSHKLAPSMTQVNNNTGTIISKLTKKFERWKSTKVVTPNSISSKLHKVNTKSR